MRTDSLDYKLPPELIAQQPAARRSESKLLVLDRNTGRVTDTVFNRITEYLNKSDCLVINKTKVLQARFFARRKTGGKLEALFLEAAGENSWQVMLKGAAKVKEGEQIFIKERNGEDYCTAELVEKTSDGRCVIQLENSDNFEKILDRIGFTPLPPYIKRSADTKLNEIDRRRYQTVYAEHAGAVAAPTAGLHFTSELIEQLKEQGVKFASVTLHVGAGTFKPIKAEKLEEHKIHSERFIIDEQNAAVINATKRAGGRVIAVGTTSVRVLETAAKDRKVKAARGQTSLFITPGFEFNVVDAMVTNFHLPRSSLLALVAAFAGLENILSAYNHAIENSYRFYSYGDAMLIV